MPDKNALPDSESCRPSTNTPMLKKVIRFGGSLQWAESQPVSGSEYLESPNRTADIASWRYLQEPSISQLTMQGNAQSSLYRERIVSREYRTRCTGLHRHTAWFRVWPQPSVYTSLLMQPPQHRVSTTRKPCYRKDNRAMRLSP